MPNNMVNGFNINGTPVPYNYDSLGNKLEKTSIAREYSNIDTYDVDEYVVYNGRMYRCKQKILVGESFDPTKWAECSTGTELNYIKKYYSINDGIKQALLNLLYHVAYADEHGQDYLDDLEAELFRTADLVSISAVFEQGSAVIYDTDDLDTLRQYLTVTATYEDLSTREITAYTLSGTLTDGTSTITVSYGGKTAEFDVTVTGVIYHLENHTFDGSNSSSIPTGIRFLETNRAFSVLANVDFNNNTGINWRLFVIMNGTSPYPGVSFQRNDNTNNTLIQWMTTKKNDVALSPDFVGNVKFAYTYEANSNKLNYQYKIGNGAVVSGTLTDTFQTITAQLTIGGQANGTCLFKGKVNELTVYPDALDSSVVSAFMGE